MNEASEITEAGQVEKVDAASLVLRRPVPQRDFVLRRMLALADIVAIEVALACATSSAPVGTSGVGQFGWGSLTVAGWILLFKAYGLYDRDAKRVSHATVDDVPWIFHALVVGSLGLWMALKLAPSGRLTFREGVTFFAVSAVALFVLRALARKIASIAIPPERVLLVGGGRLARVLAEKMHAHPEYRLAPVGYVDVLAQREGGFAGELPFLGHLDELESVCVDAGVERVVVVSSEVDEHVLLDAIRSTKALDLRVSILPQVSDVLGPSVEIDDVEGVTILGVNPGVLTPSSRFLKRTMDVSLSFVALIVLSPVMLAVAVAIFLTSGRPIIYSQERIGRGGSRFWIHKFRTMVPNADALAEGLRDLSAHPAWLLLEHDPRITSLGRVLRRASLDELPQLWNVLKGDMSLVGPRPMPPDVDQRILGWGRRRLDLTPGVTGLWQVLGRTTISFDEMVKLDYLYVTNWSLWQDVRLLIHTLPAVARRRGAN